MVAKVSHVDLPLFQHLGKVVRHLLDAIPGTAHTIQVNVVIDNLTEVVGGKVNGYPVNFVSPSEEHQAGDVYLTWCEGQLESAPVVDDVYEALRRDAVRK